MCQAKMYKKQKIFFCALVLKFRKMSTANICDEAGTSKIAGCNLVKSGFSYRYFLKIRHK